MKKKLLIQTQLSNYNSQGKFDLACDSGWNMMMGRVREMLKLNPDLYIDIMGPYYDYDGQNQLVEEPWKVNKDIFDSGRVLYIQHWIIPNALVTRYDFDFDNLSYVLKLEGHKKDASLRYDAVYINDPMHLRNFKVLFYSSGGYRPKFYVHSHFVDNPTCPKFPLEASLWLGQCEAAIRADYNFWQCESAMNVFFNEMKDFYKEELVEYTKLKSTPWDDGYSSTEISSTVNVDNLRYDKMIDEFNVKTSGKCVIFVPNRIGGKGRSSDYTNCGKFMFEILPELRKLRDDFVVIAGNPSQRFTNNELETLCGENGYINLVPETFNRDEYKYIVGLSDIVVGLYDQDSYGSTASRECVDLGCVPLWIDNFEYSVLSREAGYTEYLAKPDFSDIASKTSQLIDLVKNRDPKLFVTKKHLQRVIREKCSYESTTPKMMQIMNLLP
jgi:hypothetical protein